MTIHRAMILAAGKGTRLAPLTHTRPKPLMEVAGRPMLVHLLEFLRAGGIDEVVMNLHHLGHRIEAAIGDGTAFGMRVRYSHEDPILDTGGGIAHAHKLLGDEPFVVANGDSLLEVPLRELLAFHRDRGGVATLALRPDPEAARYGLIEMDAADRVRRIVGLPDPAAGVGPDTVLRGFMFPGLHVLEPEIFRWMEDPPPFSITRLTYPRLLAAGRPLFGWVTSARWVNIDTPAALAETDRTLRAEPFRFV
jgi:NDP-sugar pyrophosphorylase family protein